MRYPVAVVLCLAAVATAPDLHAQIVSEQEISATEGNLGSSLLSFSDFFGSSVASVGDIDRDGVLDLAVGAEGDDGGGRDAGAVHLLFMKPDGTVGSAVKWGAFELPSGALDPGDYFGSSVAGLADLNGDGFRDVAVGARGDDDTSDGPGESSGAVWILFLNEAGSVIGSQKISEVEGGFTGTLDAGDLFGRSVAFLGDIGEDGTKEIAVGAPGDDDGGSDRGAVWVLSLNADGTVAESDKISDGNDLAADALSDYGAFGTAVVRLAAPDTDGLPVAIGAPFSKDRHGEFWFTELRPGVTVAEATVISDAAGDLVGMINAGDHFGRSLAAPGDLDGDGLFDVIVGAPGGDDAGDEAGQFWFVGLEPGEYSATAGGFTGRLEAGDRFGQALAAIGDLDANGKVDYAVGAPFGNDGVENSGSVYILFDDRANPVAVDDALPEQDVFVEPYPNPLAGDGVFQVRLAADRYVRIEVFDIVGRMVATVHDGPLRAGTRYQLPVSVSSWPSGTYVYRITSDQAVSGSSFVVAR